MTREEQAELLVEMCRKALCGERQVEVVRRLAAGETQGQVATALSITQPAVCQHLARARELVQTLLQSEGASGVAPALPRSAVEGAAGGRYPFVVWLWHCILGDVLEEDEEHWHRMTRAGQVQRRAAGQGAGRKPKRQRRKLRKEEQTTGA